MYLFAVSCSLYLGSYVKPGADSVNDESCLSAARPSERLVLPNIFRCRTRGPDNRVICQKAFLGHSILTEGDKSTNWFPADSY